MTEKVKKGSELPKAQKSAVMDAPVMEAPKKTKRRTIKRKEKEFRHCEYIIPKKAGVVYMLPQKGVTVYDEENDTVREMRYCPNEPSIWADEQGEKSVKESVVFRDGRIFVAKEKPNLKKFLDLHPLNMANGGSVFKLLDKRRDAEKELEKEFLLNDAISLVRDTDINDLLPVAIYFGININSKTSEIRYNLLNIARKKPQDFIEAFDSPQVQVRSSIQQAKDYQIINMKQDKVSWFDSNGLIVSVPVGQSAMDVMVRFCLTEKGASVLSLIEEKLDKLG